MCLSVCNYPLNHRTYIPIFNIYYVIRYISDNENTVYPGKTYKVSGNRKQERTSLRNKN